MSQLQHDSMTQKQLLKQARLLAVINTIAVYNLACMIQSLLPRLPISVPIKGMKFVNFPILLF